MGLSRIRMELARNHDFPQGSSAHGYEVIAPLTAAGLLDAESWPRVRDECTVRRFWGVEEERGRLTRGRGGDWYFDYEPQGADDDEPVFKLGSHRLLPDEYVSVTEHDGEQRTFRIVSVRPVPELV